MSPFHAAVTFVRRWIGKGGILRFVDDNFDVELEQWQRETLLAFESPDPAKRRVSMQAATGVGKSAVLAWCGWWFLATQADRQNHPKGAVVSITSANLKDNLWSEFAKWQGRSPFLLKAFEWTSSRIASREHPETWFLAARSWPKSASPDEQGKTLSGLHSKYVLALVDESGAIPTTVLRAAEQALSECAFGKIAQAGNPISLEGMLHAAATKLRHQWHIIRVTRDPDDPNRSRRSPDGDEWARQQIATYGRDNPWVKSYILGEFPPQSINALLGIEDVEAAIARTLQPAAYEWSQKRLGIDVARYGDDRTVLFQRQGLSARQLPVVLRHERTSAVSVDIANVAMAHAAQFGIEQMFADATGGWAAGAVDVLRANGQSPIEVQFAAPAIDPRFKNRRAEIWWLMAEWVKRGGALPNVPDLVAELTTPTYTFVGGKLQLEDKAQVKQRLGRSPDLADALALTFGLPDMPRSMTRHGHAQVGKALTDFDPYAMEYRR